MLAKCKTTDKYINHHNNQILERRLCYTWMKKKKKKERKWKALVQENFACVWSWVHTRAWNTSLLSYRGSLVFFLVFFFFPMYSLAISFWHGRGMLSLMKQVSIVRQQWWLEWHQARWSSSMARHDNIMDIMSNPPIAHNHHQLMAQITWVSCIIANTEFPIIAY